MRWDGDFARVDPDGAVAVLGGGEVRATFFVDGHFVRGWGGNERDPADVHLGVKDKFFIFWGIVSLEISGFGWENRPICGSGMASGADTISSGLRNSAVGADMMAFVAQRLEGEKG